MLFHLVVSLMGHVKRQGPTSTCDACDRQHLTAWKETPLFLRHAAAAEKTFKWESSAISLGIHVDCIRLNLISNLGLNSQLHSLHYLREGLGHGLANGIIDDGWWMLVTVRSPKIWWWFSNSIIDKHLQGICGPTDQQMQGLLCMLYVKPAAAQEKEGWVDFFWEGNCCWTGP